MLLEAFEKLTNRANPDFVYCIVYRKMLQMILVILPIYLPWRYAICHGLKCLSRSGFKLQVTHPDMILERAVRKVMGQRLPTYLGSLPAVEIRTKHPVLGFLE